MYDMRYRYYGKKHGVPGLKKIVPSRGSKVALTFASASFALPTEVSL